MNTCSTCRHWGRDYPGACDGMTGFTRVGYTQPDANGFAIRASADDDSNLQAELITGPDFGCIRWAAHDTPATP